MKNIFLLLAFSVLFFSCGTNNTQKENIGANDSSIVKENETAELKSEITCPSCGFKQQETMPTDQCKIAYTCGHCKKTNYPVSGDCCVFCSYGTEKCPSKQ